MSFLAFQHEGFWYVEKIARSVCCHNGLFDAHTVILYSGLNSHGEEFFKKGCKMDTGARVSIIAVLLYFSAFMTLFCIPRPKQNGHGQNKTVSSRSSPDLEHGGGGGGEVGLMHPIPEEMVETDLEISFEDQFPHDTTPPPSEDAHVLGSPIIWIMESTPNDSEATPCGTSQSEGSNVDDTNANETTDVEASSISPKASEEPKAEPTKEITGKNWMGAVTSFLFKRRNEEAKTDEEENQSPNEVQTIAALNDILGDVDLSIDDKVDDQPSVEEFPNSTSAIEPQLIESTDGESEVNAEEAAETTVDVPVADEVINAEKEAEEDAEQIMRTTEAVIEAENWTHFEANSEVEANASGRIDTDQTPETEIDEAGATSGIEQGQGAEDIALSIQAKVWTNEDSSSPLLSRSSSRSSPYKKGPVDLDDTQDDSSSNSSDRSSTESEQKQEAAQMQSSPQMQSLPSDEESQDAVDTKEMRDVPVDPSKTDDSSEAEGPSDEE
jgi:hypothetical protein